MPVLVFTPPNPDPDAYEKYDRMCDTDLVDNIRVLPEGAIAHIAYESPEGLVVIGIWESSEAEKVAHGSPAVGQLRESLGLRPVQVGPPLRVHNMRLSECNLRLR